MAKKPTPISRKISKKPKEKAPVPEVAPQAFNDVSPITAKQIARAERAIDNLRTEVKDLRARPPKVSVTTPDPKVEVNLPPRPRIAKVKIKYDPFGMPQELVPVYQEV
jgi:hypothetical protein